MARLALLAMLALALLPGIGRLSQHAAAAVPGMVAAQNALGAICTTRGLAYDPDVAAIEAIGFALQDDEDTRSPAPPHAGDDCDYCTIASAANAPAFTALTALALTRDTARPPRRAQPIIQHHPRGLGARGPPLTA